MKTAVKTIGRLRRFLRAPVRQSAVLAALLVATAPLSLTAQVVVDTLTGGPSHFYPQTSEGYTNGNTATDAKFNHPLGLALDSTGNNLFVADRDNNAIRRLDLAANQTFTFAE